VQAGEEDVGVEEKPIRDGDYLGGMKRRKRKRDFIPPNARDGAEVSPAQADRFAGAKREEKVGLLRSK
jgi:hypothetical protein